MQNDCCLFLCPIWKCQMMACTEHQNAQQEICKYFHRFIYGRVMVKSLNFFFKFLVWVKYISMLIKSILYTVLHQLSDVKQQSNILFIRRSCDKSNKAKDFQLGSSEHLTHLSQPASTAKWPLKMQAVLVAGIDEPHSHNNHGITFYNPTLELVMVCFVFLTVFCGSLPFSDGLIG